MTIGIYSLYWEKEDLTYIGQSQNIEFRFNAHLNSLKANRHTNYKVQKAYNLYGVPNFNIIEVCELVDLDKKEIYWTNEFNSLSNGLNIVEAGRAGRGPLHGRAKFSKLEILLTFRYLYSTSLSYKNICMQTNVSEDTVCQICNSNAHLWLKEKYPNSYAKMRNIHRSNSKFTNCIELLSPDNVIYKVFNRAEFCRIHNLQPSNLCKLIKGKLRAHKGWVLKK